ncbi:pyridoxal-phosphate dependent enzyme [Candidatus Woesearchaeota archaeon]|nr:pyridoxal-phosphate dependent enzyme [Candidatus Woesearchaeota archaeon]
MLEQTVQEAEFEGILGRQYAEKLGSERAGLYLRLRRLIRPTTVEIYEGPVPNDNEIHIIRLDRKPFGSHYDDVYLSLFLEFEGTGQIVPGDKVLETTSGSAGVSFAGIGRELGYRCIVAIPAGGEQARVDAIKAQGAEVILTDAEKYVSGFPRWILRYLATNRDVTFLNHSMGPTDPRTRKPTINGVTIEAMSKWAYRARAQIGLPDIYFPGIGNGSSVLGPGGTFGAYVIGFESVLSGVVYELIHPGRYEGMFGVEPGSLGRHNLPGLSGKGIEFPHIEAAIRMGYLNEVVLVGDGFAINLFREVTGRSPPPEHVVRWDAIDPGDPSIGRTGRASIAVALDTARKVHGLKFATVSYDSMDRYDSAA